MAHDDLTDEEVLRKVEGLAELAAALQRTEVRESVRRGELAAALSHSLVERARLQDALRDQALALYRTIARARRHPRRTPAAGRMMRRVLARAGVIGQTLLIAQSGLWRRTDNPIFDLRLMAAYARRGADPTTPPSTLMDQAWYLERNPDVAARGFSPLVHHVLTAASEDRAPHPLFDPAFYRRENREALAATGLPPLEHFLRLGAAEGRDPHPLFSIRHYLGQCPDAAASGENPLTHYLETGWALDYSPHPLFRPRWYRARLPRSEAAQPPLAHYLKVGWTRGLKPHPLFDPSWYWAENPDVAAAGLEPLSHYVAAGAAEDRNPSPWFDARHYRAARGEALAKDANPLIDYLETGAWSVGEPRPGFAASAYLAARAGMALEGLTPLEHWAMNAGNV